MQLVPNTSCRCLYRVVPVSCAKEHDDTAAADMKRAGDSAITAGRQNRRSGCTKRL